jgi:tripartite-type tricarboxylate transporter receptor subunit TctC
LPIYRTLSRLVALAPPLLATAPAGAQFYKDRALNVLINFAVGGNADVEARVFQRYLGRHIPGNPAIVIQNAPGAGGLNAMNMLGLGLGPKTDGTTVGYFTMNSIALILGDPGLKVALSDFHVVAGARGWNVSYGRSDIPPGVSKPADLARASSVFIGGYARSNPVDVRMRLAMSVLGIPHKVVTGFPGTADVNKAMLQGEVNITASSLPAFRTQAIPQIIKTGVGLPLFHFPVTGGDGKSVGNPALEKEGIPTFSDLYAQARGKAPSGPEFDTMMLVGTLGTQMLRGVMLPKAAPPEAIETLASAFNALARDAEFLAEYERVIGEQADFASAQELKPLIEQMRNVDPRLKDVLRALVSD